MGLILVILVIGNWGQGLSRPLWPKPPAESISYYFDPYPPDEILPPIWDDVNEASCGGCCLFTGIGTFLGYKFFKEKPMKQEGKRLSIGVNYSLGAAKDEIGFHLGGDIVDPTKAFYWVNRLGITIGYKFRPLWALEAGFGYMWGVVMDRYEVFEYYPDRRPVGTDWEISAFSPSLVIEFLKEKDKFCMIGIEWYFVKGIDHGYKRWPDVPVTIITKSNAPGGLFGFGLSPRLASFLQLEFSILGRYGHVKNPDYWGVEEEVVRSEDFSLSFSGVYLNLGVKYNLSVRKGGAK